MLQNATATLLQNATAILLQNPTEVYYKMGQVFYYIMRQFYCKMWWLLQIATVHPLNYSHGINKSIKNAHEIIDSKDLYYNDDAVKLYIRVRREKINHKAILFLAACFAHTIEQSL